VITNSALPGRPGAAVSERGFSVTSAPGVGSVVTAGVGLGSDFGVSFTSRVGEGVGLAITSTFGDISGVAVGSGITVGDGGGSRIVSSAGSES